MTTTAVHPVDERLPLAKPTTLGIQHVLHQSQKVMTLKIRLERGDGRLKNGPPLAHVLGSFGRVEGVFEILGGTVQSDRDAMHAVVQCVCRLTAEARKVE